MSADELQEMGREIREKADDVREEVVRQLHNAAETIRKEVREAKVDGDLVNKADGIATGLEKAANYLNSRTVDELGGEAVEIVRKNPWRNLAIIFIVGLVIGIFLRRD
jgi:ElaB/YqjD/DUF883 family membrane-anchored ribosome-binding protein